MLHTAVAQGHGCDCLPDCPAAVGPADAFGGKVGGQVCCVQLQQLWPVEWLVCKAEGVHLLLIGQHEPSCYSLLQQLEGLRAWLLPHISTSSSSTSSNRGSAWLCLDAAQDSSNTVAASWCIDHSVVSLLWRLRLLRLVLLWHGLLLLLLVGRLCILLLLVLQRCAALCCCHALLLLPFGAGLLQLLPSLLLCVCGRAV